MNNWAFPTLLILSAAVLSLVVCIFILLRTLQRHKSRARALEQAAKGQDLWTAFISHELRNPLFALNTHLGLLGFDKQLPPKLHLHLDACQEASQNIQDLVSDILDSAQIRSGAFALNPSQTQISKLAHSIYDTYKPLASAKGLQLSLRIAPSTPKDVYLDGLRLRQVLTNLVSNAIKYTDSGEVSIQIESSNSFVSDQIQHSITKPKVKTEALTVRVVDTGKGISKEELNYIFEPFYMSEINSQNSPHSPPSAASLSASKGLGLAIVQSITRASGWQIIVESNANPALRPTGSEFKLFIPLVPFAPDVPNIPIAN